MITYVAEHNDKLYDALFEDIRNSTGITEVRSIEEYFMHLQEIAEFVIKGPEVNGVRTPRPDKTYFLRLPVDENMVNINANTRNITLSEAYRRNGVAVVGDAYAETLWFSIDRYYDLQDLYLTKVFIFWELPNKDKVKGCSEPAFRDIHSEAGKLIFSWTIPNLLTETAGNVKFYVSFQSNDGSYIFNTLPQTAKINATLDAKINEVTSDGVNQESILKRLHSTTDVGAIVVARPNISECSSDGEVDILTEDNPVQYIDVCAYSYQDGCTLEYTLYKNGQPYSAPVEDVYVETKDIASNEHKTYYDALHNVIDFIPGAYEKGKRFTIGGVGSYQCKVVAYKIVGNSQVPNYSAPAYSTRWLWEEPTVFQIQKNTVTFKDNEFGIIYKASDTHPNDQGLVIAWPMANPNDSKQQKSATYKAEINIAPVAGAVTTDTQIIFSNDNATQEVVIANPFVDAQDNLVVGTSEISIKFSKVLNNMSIPANEDKRPEIKLSIQSEAQSYDISTIVLSDTLIKTGENITVTLDASELLEAQEYYYCWQRQSNGKWVDATNLALIDKSKHTISDSFGNSGTYQLKIVAKYGKDHSESYSSIAEKILVVYSVAV